MGENILHTTGVKHMSTPVLYHATRRGTNSLVRDKPSEDSETAVQQYSPIDRESANPQRKSHDCQGAERDDGDGDGSQEWSDPVEVFSVAGADRTRHYSALEYEMSTYVAVAPTYNKAPPTTLQGDWTRQ
jgi:hypothetical protein